MADLTTDQTGHYATGIVLIAFAVLSLCVGIVGVIIPSFTLTFIFTILAMILGHYSFKQFAIADGLKRPPIPPFQKRDERSFIIPFRSGAQATIAIEIDFESAIEQPFVSDKIMAGIQRRLREEFLAADTLPKSPFKAIDAILLPDAELMRTHLHLTKLEIRTIDIDPGVVPTPPTDHWK
jgi:hypothetical protein